MIEATARLHLEALCAHPHRHPGSAGNHAAVDYVRRVLTDLGWSVAGDTLKVIDWEHGECLLLADGADIPAHVGFFSPSCDVAAPIVAVATVDELAAADCAGKLLLAHGELTREQLLPPAFPFLDWPEHARIYQLLNEKQPAAILAVTDSNPGFTGGLRPFPWIDDGEFAIPHAYCHTDHLDTLLAATSATLRFESRRIPGEAVQLRASLGQGGGPRIVCTAHVDTKPATPGALDNATGVVTLLLLAERLRDHDGAPIELVFVNSEDYWDVTGEKLLVEQNAGRWDDIALNINLDALGSRGSLTGYSAFGLSDAQQAALERATLACPSAAPMEPWYASDHMVFVQQGRPAVAVTSTNFEQLCEHITHTDKDTIDGVDLELLPDAATCLHDLLKKMVWTGEE